MAKSKKSAIDGRATKKNERTRKGKKESSSKKASSSNSKHIIKFDANTGEKVYIETVTLSQIKKAKKTGECPHPKSKRVLVRIPSHETRQTCYKEAADAIAYWEEQLLPAYGNRKWKVSVELDEPAKRKTPLFRWYRGKLELAVIPHLLETVPMEREVMPKGRMKKLQDAEEEEHVPATELTERQISSLSEFAYESLGDEYGIPIVTMKWISPNHQVFRQRSKAEEHAKMLVEQTLFLDKVLEGYGSRGQPLRPTKCTRAEALKAGRLRFLRDGLWVVGQEDMWQADRADQVEAQQLAAQQEALLKPDTAKQQRRRPPSDGSTKQRRSLTALAYFLQSERAKLQQKRLAELRKKRKNAPDTVSFTLREAEQELRQVWREMNKREKNQWQRWFMKEKERLEKENATERQPQMDAKPAPTTSQATTTNQPPPPRLVEDHPAAVDRKATSLECAGLETLVSRGNPSTGVGKFDGSHSPDVLAVEAAVVKEVKCAAATSTCALGGKPSTATIPLKHLAESSIGTDRISPFPSSYRKPEFLAPQPMVTPEGSEQEEVQSNTSSSCSGDTVTMDQAGAERSSVPSVISQARLDTKPPALPSKRPAFPMSECNQLVTKTKYKRKPRRNVVRRFAQSNLWRLPDDMINLCYDACMEHYDQVMNTVKARGLNFELADGFDVLRERGRGRYDMELPAFDTPQFNFLTSLDDAPWMPLVREILGTDVVLIHKGSFLSMPGASAQVYHQDGPHLTTRTQMPCHAVNVFVPLVDLEANNGPTEFCLGSHILGFEDYEEGSIYTPTVPAGTPIIFDYRLGHRGLANRSKFCRPLVYCTYAASKDGKEFRDSVNFSRKRYHRIGEMIAKPLSREERTKKRKLELEERAYQRQIDKLLVQSAKEAEEQARKDVATAVAAAGKSVVNDCAADAEPSKAAMTTASSPTSSSVSIAAQNVVKTPSNILASAVTADVIDPRGTAEPTGSAMAAGESA